MAKPKAGKQVSRGTPVWKRARKRARAKGTWKDTRKGGLTFGEARGLAPAGSPGGGGGGGLRAGIKERAKTRAPLVGLEGLLKGGLTKPEVMRIKRKWVKGGRPKPFNVLEPQFISDVQFNKAVANRAKGLSAPLQNQLNQEAALGGRVHEGRVADLGRWQGGYQSAIDSAYADTQKALNDLAAINAGSNTTTQGSMAAALRGIGEQGQQQAMIAGGADTAAPVAPAMTAAAQNLAGLQASQNAFTGRLGNQIAQTGTLRALPSQLGLQGMTRENQRYGGVLEDIQGKRRDLAERMPAFKEQARAALIEEERSRQAQKWQQGFARRQQGETERAAKAGEKIQRRQISLQKWIAQAGFKLDREKMNNANQLSWAQLAFQDKQLSQQKELALAELTSQAGGMNGELAGKRWDNAVATMTAYFKPDAQQRKKGKQFNASRNPEELYRMLTVQTGLPRRAALRLMSSAAHTRTRQWANNLRKKHNVGDVLAKVGKGRGDWGLGMP